MFLWYALAWRHKAAQRASRRIRPHAACVLRVQGDHLPACRRRLHVRLFHVSDGQGDRFPLHPPLRHRQFGQLSSFGRTGQIFMVRPCVAGQGRTTRLTPDQAVSGVRTEGAGRSSPCPPEASLCAVVSCLRRARGQIPLASPVAPRAFRSAEFVRAYGADFYGTPLGGGARPHNAPHAGAGRTRRAC